MKRKQCSPFAAAIKTAAAITFLLTGLFLLLYLRFGSGWLLSTLITFGTTFYHFAMRLLVGALVPGTLRPERPWFSPRSWEPGLYRVLKVKKWKKHLPTYAPELFSPAHYTPRQIVCHMCQAEVVHELIALCSLLPLLAVPVFGALPVFLITSCAAAAADLAFAMIQRYNRPRLLRLVEKQAATQPQKEIPS